MSPRHFSWGFSIALSLVVAPACAHGGPCADDLAVQVLGSGGPIPDDARASAGYLVWQEGRARALVDAGGGVFLRAAEAGLDLAHLDVIALTHLHADHSADLAALMKGSFFSERRRDLPLVGPSGAGAFPGLGEWADSLFGAKGAYRYLSWLLDPGEGAWSLRLLEQDATGRASVEVLADGDLTLQAVGVEHGPVPALAYRVELDGRTVVFSGDQNGRNPQFTELARDADVLVMHHAVPEAARGVATNLHARPSEIGKLAHDAGVKHLVLSHHMERSLADLEGGLATLRASYRGKVTVAEDLTCIPVE